MDTIVNIAVSLPNTVAIADTSKEVIFHSCPNTSSNEVILLSIAIGLIVLAGLAIISHYVCKGIATTQLNKFKELKAMQEHEISKLETEAKIRMDTNKFNAEQTKEQREWLSEADKIKNEMERHNVRLKSAEVDIKTAEVKKEITKRQ